MQAAIREALIAHAKADFEATFAGEQMAYDNAPFDWANPPAHFIEFNVRFYDGGQIGASAAPRTRIKGFVYVTANIREGLGSKQPLAMLDWFAGKLGYATLAGAGCRIVLKEPQPTGSSEPKGWYSEHLKIQFYADPA